MTLGEALNQASRELGWTEEKIKAATLSSQAAAMSGFNAEILPGTEREVVVVCKALLDAAGNSPAVRKAMAEKLKEYVSKN